MFTVNTSELNNDESDSSEHFEFETLNDIILYLEKKPINPHVDFTTTNSKPNQKIKQVEQFKSELPKQRLRCQG